MLVSLGASASNTMMTQCFNRMILEILVYIPHHIYANKTELCAESTVYSFREVIIMYVGERSVTARTPMLLEI